MKKTNAPKVDSAAILTEALARPIIEGEKIYTGAFAGISATISKSQLEWYETTKHRTLAKAKRDAAKAAKALKA